MKTINFTKMVASGNDFVIIENPKSDPSTLAKEICDRRYGVGADGLLILERSKVADFKMRIFNPDGSEAEMCGNGARCVALYAKENKMAGHKMRIDTIAGIIEAEVSNDKIKLKMFDPRDIKPYLNIQVDSKNYKVSFVDTGVPHAVMFVEHLDSWDVKRIGRAIRYHKSFAPKGTNVNFVEVQKENFVKVRTYERGVEDETLACGTGVVASAVISAISKRFKGPITCLTKSGEKLKVYFKRNEDNFTAVYLEGRARAVFCGEYFLK